MKNVKLVSISKEREEMVIYLEEFNKEFTLPLNKADVLKLFAFTIKLQGVDIKNICVDIEPIYTIAEYTMYFKDGDFYVRRDNRVAKLEVSTIITSFIPESKIKLPLLAERNMVKIDGKDAIPNIEYNKGLKETSRYFNCNIYYNLVDNSIYRETNGCYYKYMADM